MTTPFTLRNMPDTLHALLDMRAEADPDHVFTICDDGTLTYGELAERSRAVAAHLHAAGVRPGERVMLMMEGSRAYLEIWFGLSRLGATEAPMNPAYKGALLTQLIETSDARVAILAEPFRQQFAEALPAGASDYVLLAPSDLAGPAPGGDAPNVDVAPTDIACVIFTSGTTGPSKGVMVSQRHQLSFGMAYAEINRMDGSDVTYNFLPFFHIAAKFMAMATMMTNARMVLIPRFSLGRFWDDVHGHGVTLLTAVGGLCHMLRDRPQTPRDADNTLRAIYAVPIPWEFKHEFEARFGLKLIEGYGSTETNLVAYSRLDAEPPVGSLGQASPHFDLQIQDPQGYPLPPGESGEICIRPKHPGTIMSGYLGQPQKTLEAWSDLWFHTGDRGHID